MITDWPETESAPARDVRWLAHVLACPHEKCRTTRRCRMRWTNARRCPAPEGAPPSEAEAAAIMARVNFELHRMAFEEDDGARREPVGCAEYQRRVSAAFERTRKRS